MRIRRRKNGETGVRLEMTPMIDVVFQLLIFFIVALKQEDILSQLKAARPSTPPDQVIEEPPPLVEITLYRDGYIYRGRPVTLDALDTRLGGVAELSRTASVVLRCTADSPHASLVRVLDTCQRHGLTNLSVLSL